MLFGHWLNQQEIPDPYRKSDEAFSYVFQLLNKASQLWVEKLAR
ncbi:protein tyrosine phosphatase [Klebsiella aerogenes]|nr:protein tyrosine phosphatase [Klebsiella aerogenes]